MDQPSANNISVIDKIIRHMPATTLAPGPTVSSQNPKAALRRCCAAWKRSFNAYLDDPGVDENRGEYSAGLYAAKAYRNAMPVLIGLDGVRDFVACLAHGILIGAIEPEISGHLIYAAQIALRTAMAVTPDTLRPQLLKP